jgi:sporulation protein YlmC with PRC-barrel domain
MDLIKDVLDNQVVDATGWKMGKVDGIVIVVREGQPPLLSYIEIGAVTLARRLHPRLGDWVASRLRGLKDDRAHDCTIPWAAVRDVGIDVEVDRHADATPVGAWERWLREHIIERIPGAS